MYIFKPSLITTITLALVSFAIASLPGSTQPIQPIREPDHGRLPFSSLTAAKQQEPDFSGAGRPGRQTSGESRGNCPPVVLPLTALMPASNWGTTVTERPSFWFYVPYSPQQAPVGEFVLQDEQRNDIYRMPFTLTKTPGFVSFSIPQTEAPLEIDQWYRWYFKLYCDPQKSSSPKFVQGWVQRIALDPALESQLKSAAPREDAVYAANRIWYDALDHLANLRLTNPADTRLEDGWNELLKAKGVGLEIPDSEGMVGSVLINKPQLTTP